MLGGFDWPKCPKCGPDLAGYSTSEYGITCFFWEMRVLRLSWRGTFECVSLAAVCRCCRNLDLLRETSEVVFRGVRSTNPWGRL